MAGTQQRTLEDERIAAFVSYDAASGSTSTRCFYAKPSSQDGPCDGSKVPPLTQYCLGRLKEDGPLILYTQLGRCYRAAQAQRRRTTPDWKLHFAISPEDLPRAWDIIAFLFIRRGCLSCLELAVNDVPCFMQGREVSVDVYRFNQRFLRGKCTFSEAEAVEFSLSKSYEQSASFWRSWVQEVEEALDAAGVGAQPLAKGDVRLGQSLFCSVRNEAFVELTGDVHKKLSLEERKFHEKNLRTWKGRTYPPSIAGYNATGDADPFSSGAVWSLSGLPPWGVAMIALTVVTVINFTIFHSLERLGLHES